MDDLNSGTQFDFTYDPGISTEQIIGFEMAGVIWSSYLDDDVTVRIHVESRDDLPDEVVGAALPGKKRKEKYDKISDSLSDDITTSNDLLAFENLPSTDKEFSVVVNGQELDKTKEFRLTNANAKSLDLLNDDRDKLDGYIVVNDFAGDSTVGWDYDALRNDNIEGNEIDFLSVALHETGHILGFTSGIDEDDWLEVLTESQEEEGEIKNKDFKFASILDLYRYSESSFATGNLDLSVGGNPYFSIDGGNTNLGNFANGQYTDFGGDGYQASHWEQNSNQGIMNPILPVGERRDVSELDLIAMDVIGWDLDTSNTLSWGEMYDLAVVNAEDAIVEDRSDDVEKMIKESDYDGRKRRRSTGNTYIFQIGYWQYSTFQTIDSPEEIPVEDVESESESGSQSTESVFIESEEESILEDNSDSSEVDLDDNFDITGVDYSESAEDPLLSGVI